MTVLTTFPCRRLWMRFLCATSLMISHTLLAAALLQTVIAGAFAKSPLFGVRWKLVQDEVADYDLPCERLGAAVGMNVKDFDHVFPWSEIRRCKVVVSNEGGLRVAYEGDADFQNARVPGQIMVEIPKHHMRREVHDGFESRWISKTPLAGFEVDRAFVEEGRELDHVYVGAYEAFIGEDGRMRSTPGVHPTADLTRGKYREHAGVNGLGFGTFDLRTLLMLQNLFLIEHADRHSQRVLGNGFGKITQPARTFRCVRPERGKRRLIAAMTKGTNLQTIGKGLYEGCAVLISSFERPQDVLVKKRLLQAIKLDEPEAGLVTFELDGDAFDTTEDMCLGGAAQMTGLSDAIPSHSGHGEFHGSPPHDSYRCAMKYRHIENLWGNLWCYLDGVNLSEGRAYVCDNMRQYQSGLTTGPYRPAGIPSVMQNDNGDIGGLREVHFLKNLGWNPREAWLALPLNCTYEGLSTLDGQSERLRSGHFGDYYYLNTKADCFVHGGGFDHYWRCGLFTLRGWATDTQHWYLYGSRLIYKPLK